MSEKEHSSGFRIRRAIGSELQSTGAFDVASLRDTLVKSSQWKKNTLNDIEAQRAGANDGDDADDVLLEVARLRQAIVELEAENSRLIAEHQMALDARDADLENLQAAYDQFEQQSDELLDELDRQNARLRDECRIQNRRSVL